MGEGGGRHGYANSFARHPNQIARVSRTGGRRRSTYRHLSTKTRKRVRARREIDRQSALSSPSLTSSPVSTSVRGRQMAPPVLFRRRGTRVKRLSPVLVTFSFSIRSNPRPGRDAFSSRPGRVLDVFFLVFVPIAKTVRHDITSKSIVL